MKRSAAILLVLVVACGGLSGCGRDGKASVYTGVLEGKSVEVPAMTGGKVISLLVDTGEEVASGDTLVLTDTSELVLQREQLTAGLE